MWQDVMYGLRVVRTRPGFALVIVLTLALGIGAGTATFSAVNALLLRSLPVEDVDRVVFGMALREGHDPFGTSFLEYDLFREAGKSFSDSGLGSPRLFTLIRREEPERLRGAAVTAGYLRTLGVAPALGRIFSEEEDRPGGPAVALVSHAVWQRFFDADPGLVGKTLNLADRSCTVLGVMPAGFDAPYAAEVWVPMQVAADALPLAQRAANGNEFVARLAPGVTVEQADAETKGLARRLEQEHPQFRRGWSYGIVPLRSQLLADLEGRTGRLLVALMAAVGFLLLICCANVGNLMLARGVARETEMAIRVSLGAGRWRLVRQLLCENLVLAIAGGAAGLLLAFWIQPVLRWLNPVQASGLGAYLTDFRIDAPVLLFSMGVTLSALLLFGLAPALLAARSAGPMAALRRIQGGSAGVGGGRSLGAFVVGEIALAATLLVAGGLMLQSFLRLQAVDMGFRPDGLLTVELPLSPERYPGTTEQARFAAQTLERVRALPGVAAAGMTTNVPLQRGMTLDSVFEAEGSPAVDPAKVPITAHRAVTPGYLETLGATLLAGRLLDERDDAAAPLVAVVSEELVRQAWPGEDAIGRRIRRLGSGTHGPWMTIVGVVRDTKEDRFGFRIDRPAWYLPLAQQPRAVPVGLPLNLVMRVDTDAAAVVPAVRAAIHAIDSRQPVASAMPMRSHLSDVLVAERFSAMLMATFAALGLVLAALGLYGVMAYAVGRRTGEIGLRLALGASPRDVLRLVFRQGLALIAAGLLIGVAGARFLSGFLAGMLYEVDPTDLATFLIVPLVLAAVALAACWLPAWRAARISPMVALKHE